MLIVTIRKTQDLNTLYNQAPKAAPSAEINLSPQQGNIPLDSSDETLTVDLYLKHSDANVSSFSIDLSFTTPSNDTLNQPEFDINPKMSEDYNWTFPYINLVKTDNSNPPTYHFTMSGVSKSTDGADILDPALYPNGYKIGSFTLTAANTHSGTVTATFDLTQDETTGLNRTEVRSATDGQNILTNSPSGSYTLGQITPTSAPTPSPTPAATYYQSFTPQGLPGSSWNTAEEVLQILKNNGLNPVFIYRQNGYIGTTTTVSDYHFLGTNDNNFTIQVRLPYRFLYRA